MMYTSILSLLLTDTGIRVYSKCVWENYKLNDMLKEILPKEAGFGKWGSQREFITS